MIRTFRHPDGMVQRLAVADLLNGGGGLLRSMAADPVPLVYSDPPWNPGNEKWWRRHAGAEPPADYNHFLDAWCRTVAAFAPLHVFSEQSANDRHRGMFLDAVGRCPGWTLPLLEQWTVYYGSPGSASCRRPNVLLHFGTDPLRTDPSGMAGVPMTRRVFEGISLDAPVTVADPCMGKGMTSRLAHDRVWNVVGTELNARRLDYTIRWLLKAGYVEQP